MSDKIQLYVGYMGVTREGKRVEIVNGTSDYLYPWRGCNNETYTHCGSFSSNRNDARDIVRPLGKPVNYNDGSWHRWSGDAECPVHKDSVVQVKYLEGKTVGHSESLACLYVWGSVSAPIFAFRVAKEYAEPREFWLLAGQYYCSDPGDKNAIHVREVT